MTYRLSDTRAQEQILAEQFKYGIKSTADYQQVVDKMRKRVSRFYGLNNKYDGKGNRR